MWNVLVWINYSIRFLLVEFDSVVADVLQWSAPQFDLIIQQMSHRANILSHHHDRWPNYRRVSPPPSSSTPRENAHVSAIDWEIFGVEHFRDLTKFLTVFLCAVSTLELMITTALGVAVTPPPPPPGKRSASSEVIKLWSQSSCPKHCSGFIGDHWSVLSAMRCARCSSSVE